MWRLRISLRQRGARSHHGDARTDHARSSARTFPGLRCLHQPTSMPGGPEMVRWRRGVIHHFETPGLGRTILTIVAHSGTTPPRDGRLAVSCHESCCSSAHGHDHPCYDCEYSNHHESQHSACCSHHGDHGHRGHDEHPGRGPNEDCRGPGHGDGPEQDFVARILTDSGSSARRERDRARRLLSAQGGSRRVEVIASRRRRGLRTRATVHTSSEWLAHTFTRRMQ